MRSLAESRSVFCPKSSTSPPLLLRSPAIDGNQRGLPATARTDEEGELPAMGVEIDAAQDLDARRAFAEILAEIAAMNCEICWRSSWVQPRKTMAGSSTSTRRRLRMLARIIDDDHARAGQGDVLPHQDDAARGEVVAAEEVEELRGHAGAERETNDADRERLQQDHADEPPVGDADGFDAPRTVSDFQR